jgi:hypothetical protein
VLPEHAADAITGVGTSMADLKKMTVRALRDLARKHIGPGYSKLKTKSELVAALSRVIPRAVQDVLEPEPPEETAGAEEAEVGVAGPAPQPPAEEKAPWVAQPPEEPVAAVASAAGEESRVPASLGSPEPDPEGHLVARLAGEQAARHAEIPLVEEKVPPRAGPSLPPDFDEDLGELPASYGEDQVVLLPKDPRSVFLYWDFARETIDRAFAWMPGLHTRIRLFADGELVRDQDFALESRCWYFHDLDPGRTYRAELMSLGTDGQARRIGPASNPLRLPGQGPSPITDDRFIRIPFDVPAGRLAEAMRQAAEVRGAPPPFEEEARERLYEMSGGATRPAGSSEQLQEGAGQPSATAAPTGVRSSGPWPWSGSLTRRSS